MMLLKTFSTRCLCSALVMIMMVFLSGCSSSILSASPGSLIIPKTVFYDEASNVRDKIRYECNMEVAVPKQVKEYARGKYDEIYFSDKIPPSTPAKVLSLKILNAQGLGGGYRSGPKSLTVEGTLTQNGNILGSFTAHRATMGGRHRGTKGTCDLLDRCAVRIGKDVGVWLEKPTVNALLGTAKPKATTVESTAEMVVDTEESIGDKK